MARPKKSGLFDDLPSDASLSSIAGRAAFGNLHGTSGEIVCDWVRMDNDRIILLLRLRSLASKVSLLPGTLGCRAWLERWFDDAEDKDGNLDWDRAAGLEAFSDILSRKEEMQFRADTARLHEKIRQRKRTFQTDAVAAMRSLDAAYFSNIATMITKVLEDAHARIPAAKRSHHPKHVICVIAAVEQMKEDAARGIPSNGLHAPLPRQGKLTLSQLREKFCEFTGKSNPDGLALDRVLRRWCKEVGYILQRAPMGRPPKKGKSV